MADQEKKILIDEDWKAQVRREKEEAAQKQQQPEEQPAEQSGGTPEEVPDQGSQEATPFQSLVQSLATQALFSLGAIAPRDSQEVQVDIQQARLLVDMLADLRKKTTGNLSKDEAGMLSETVAELQRLYVVRAQQVQQSQFQQAGVDPNDLKGQQPQ